MRAIDIRDLDIPEQDADYDELADFADKIAVLATDAIEVEPVRRGRWLHGREVSRDYISGACVAIHYEKWWCSKCNYTVDNSPLWNYCPNCGANMRGEKDG